jgi:hypothetical protein
VKTKVPRIASRTEPAYVFVSRTEYEDFGLALCWSTKEGWVRRDDATKFNASERDRLPVPGPGGWELYTTLQLTRPMTHNECATVLAALCFWEEHRVSGGQIPDSFDMLEDACELGPAQIDALCDAIELVPVEIPRKAARQEKTPRIAKRLRP